MVAKGLGRLAQPGRHRRGCLAHSSLPPAGVAFAVDARLQPLTRPEGQHAARQDGHLDAGLGVAADTAALLAHQKGAEAGDLHGLAGFQHLGDALQHGLQQLGGFVARKPHLGIDGLGQSGTGQRLHIVLQITEMAGKPGSAPPVNTSQRPMRRIRHSCGRNAKALGSLQSGAMRASRATNPWTCSKISADRLGIRPCRPVGQLHCPGARVGLDAAQTWFRHRLAWCEAIRATRRA
jgi:hypothetical protein